MDFSTKSTINKLEERTAGHRQMHVGLLYTIDKAHPTQKDLEGCDIGQLIGALEVNNRPRWATEFSPSFVRPLTVHESEICKVYSRNTHTKKKKSKINKSDRDLVFH